MTWGLPEIKPHEEAEKAERPQKDEQELRIRVSLHLGFWRQDTRVADAKAQRQSYD